MPGKPEPLADRAKCMDCGGINPVWFAPNAIWNLVIGGPDARGDPGGFYCPSCFIQRAEAAELKPTAWELRPEILDPLNTRATPALPDERYELDATDPAGTGSEYPPFTIYDQRGEAVAWTEEHAVGERIIAALSTPIAPLPDEAAVERATRTFLNVFYGPGAANEDDYLGKVELAAMRAALASIPSTYGGLREAPAEAKAEIAAYRAQIVECATMPIGDLSTLDIDSRLEVDRIDRLLARCDAASPRTLPSEGVR